MQMVRTGNSIVFQEGKTEVGIISIDDLGTLVAAGSTAPVKSGTMMTGVASRKTQGFWFVYQGKIYTCPWTEFKACALTVGKSAQLSGLGATVAPRSNTPPILETEQNTPTVHDTWTAKCSEKNEYYQIPPKKIKNRSTAKPSFTRQNHRTVPAGGIS